MASVFLSHSSKDRFFARKLAETLKKYGVTVWIDEAELRVGDSLIDKISTAINQADFVAAVLSHNSVNSNWVQKELSLAMSKELAGRRIVVLPILIDRCELPSFLSDKLYADFTDSDNFDAPMQRLLHAVGVSIPTTTTPSPPTTTSTTTTSTTTPAPDTLVGFDDIRIVGLDDNRLYRPDPTKALYHVYFELSSRPPMEWSQIFDAERRFPRHTMWRRAWVEEKHIVVHCVPSEVKQYHLKDIKQDVANSNAKYREFLRRVAQEEARKVQRETREQAVLDDAFDGLDFG
jgi:hypothetical protein